MSNTSNTVNKQKTLFDCMNLTKKERQNVRGLLFNIYKTGDKK